MEARPFNATYSSSFGLARFIGGLGFPVPAALLGRLAVEVRLGVSGDFQLRLNGLVAGVNSANNTGVLMQFFTFKPDQRWHTHAA